MAQEHFLDSPMPDILAQWRHYLDLLTLQADARVLDVGCGSGDALRLLVRTFPAVGEAVGLDKNLDRYAANHAQASGEARQISFRSGNGQALPFDDSSFDRVLCVDVLEWVSDPVQALQEIRRVLRPEGVALIVHSDFDAQVFATSDRERNRRIVHAFSDAGPNGQTGRELFGLCRQSGFASIEASVYVLVNTEWRLDLYGYQVAHMMTEWLANKQLIAESVLANWLDDLRQRDAAGCFFYSINRNICRCVK